MLTKTKNDLFKIVFSLIFLLLLPFSSKAAIGLSPPEVWAPSVFRGIEQSFSMRLSRSGSTDEPLTIDVTKRGEFAHFVEGASQVIIPAGENAIEYDFKIVPTDAANGDYEVIISFLVGNSGPSDTSGGNSVKVVTGVSGVVKFTVSGEELVAYEVSNLLGKDTEIGQPLFVSVNIKNNGNVEWQPEKIGLTFADVNDPTNIFSKTVAGDKISVIKPGGEVSVVDIELTSALIAGTYVATAQIYYQGQAVEELESAKFSVYPSGTLAQRGELTSASTNKTAYDLGEKIKLDAVFKNIGKILVKGVLMTEIYKGDEYIDVVRGEEIYSDINEETEMSLLIDLDEAGDYRLSSYVKYGNKKTDSVETLVVVGGGAAGGAAAGTALGFMNSWVGIALLILILVIVVVVIKVLKGKKRLQIQP